MMELAGREPASSWVRLGRAVGVDPAAENGDALLRPLLVAGHRAVRDPFVNLLCVPADVLVRAQVEGEAHRLDVALAEEGADVAREARDLSVHAAIRSNGGR